MLLLDFDWYTLKRDSDLTYWNYQTSEQRWLMTEATLLWCKIHEVSGHISGRFLLTFSFRHHNNTSQQDVDYVFILWHKLMITESFQVEESCRRGFDIWSDLTSFVWSRNIFWDVKIESQSQHPNRRSLHFSSLATILVCAIQKLFRLWGDGLSDPESWSVGRTWWEHNPFQDAVVKISQHDPTAMLHSSPISVSQSDWHTQFRWSSRLQWCQ